MDSHLSLVAPPDADPTPAAPNRTSTPIIAYQTALNVSMTTSIQAWLMSLVFLPFGILIAVWSAYPAATGTGIPVVDTLVGMCVTFAGMMGSLGMGAQALRSQKQALYWRSAARELEGHLGGIDLLKREQTLLSGESVAVAGERMRLTSLERTRRFNAFHVFYGLFTIVFAFLLMANFLRLGRVV